MMTYLYFAKQERNMTETYYSSSKQLKNGLVFNSHKCSIKKPQITFYGAIFSTKGMKPDPMKIQVLQDLPTPENHKQLQPFLGVINYLQPFLPNLPSKTTFLREQILHWDWNHSTDATFKNLISGSAKHYST